MRRSSVVVLALCGAWSVARAQTVDSGVPDPTDSASPVVPTREESADEVDAVLREIEAEQSARGVGTGRPSETPAEARGPITAPEQPASLAVIIVQERRSAFRVGGAETRIPEAQLRALSQDNPDAILTRVPSIFVRSEDGFGLRPNIGIRGANSDRSRKITLMEDGVLFAPAPYSAPAAYYFPLMARITGIDILKGPSAVEYGPNTIGGAINFRARPIPGDRDRSSGRVSQTERPGLRGLVEGELGSFLTHRIHSYVGDWNRWGGYMIEAVHLGSGGFKHIDGTSGPAGDTGFDRTEVVARARLQSDPGADVFHRFELKLGYARERSNETYLGLTDADFRADPYRRYSATQLDQMNWWRTSTALFYNLEVGENVRVVTTAYRNDFERTWRRLEEFRAGQSLYDVLADPTGVRRDLYGILNGTVDSTRPEESLMQTANHRVFVSQGIQSTMHVQFDTGEMHHEVRVGVRVHQDAVDRAHVETGLSTLAMRGVIPDGMPSRVAARNRGSAFALSAHAGYALAWSEKLTLVPAVRIEAIELGYLDRLTSTSSPTPWQTMILPGFSAHYAFTPSLGVLAGVHRGFSPTSPGQDTAIRPETAVNVEAGVRYSRTETNTLAELVGFYSGYENIVGECSFSSGCTDATVDRQYNGGRADIGGAELAASHRFDLPDEISLTMRGSYTLTFAQFSNSFTSDNPQFGTVRAGDLLPYVPQHQASAQITGEGQKWSATIAGTFTSDMVERAGPTPPRTDAAFYLDVSARYKLTDVFAVYGRIENVTDSRPLTARLPFGARPGRPLLAMFGVSAEFR